MTDILAEIKLEMIGMGWEGDAEKGFERKRDGKGVVIADGHGATWIANMDEAMRRVERKAVLREIERRDREGE